MIVIGVVCKDGIACTHAEATALIEELQRAIEESKGHAYAWPVTLVLPDASQFIIYVLHPTAPASGA